MSKTVEGKFTSYLCVYKLLLRRSSMLSWHINMMQYKNTYLSLSSKWELWENMAFKERRCVDKSGTPKLTCCRAIIKLFNVINKAGWGWEEWQLMWKTLQQLLLKTCNVHIQVISGEHQITDMEACRKKVFLSYLRKCGVCEKPLGI